MPNNIAEVGTIKKFVKFVLDVIKGVFQDHIWEYAAQAAFFMTISFIPLIMLLISMISFLPFTANELIEQIIGVFPQAARGFVSSFVNDAYKNSDATVISITAVSTLWAASIGVYAVTKGINRVYNTHETRNFIAVRAMSIVYTLLILVLIVLCLATFVFGNTIVDAIKRALPAIKGTAIIVLSVRQFAGVAILSTVFLIMFLLIPNRKLHILAEIPGAVVSGIGWVGFSSVFSYYYENLANYSYIYGSLSVMIFFMLWLFFCIYILLIGAEINRCIEDRIEHAAIMK